MDSSNNDHSQSLQAHSLSANGHLSLCSPLISVNDKQQQMLGHHNSSQFDDSSHDRGTTLVIGSRKSEQSKQQLEKIEGKLLYKVAIGNVNLASFLQQTIDVIILTDDLTTENPQFLTRQVYGAEVYSSQSDFVCIGIHSGLLSFPKKKKNIQGYQLSLRVLPGLKNYYGSEKNGYMSRTVLNCSNCLSLLPLKVKSLYQLDMHRLPRYARNMRRISQPQRKRMNMNLYGRVSHEKSESFVFDISHEVSWKYDFEVLKAQAMDKLEYHVLYLESETEQKYQLSKLELGKKKDGNFSSIQNVYAFGKLKNPEKYDDHYYSTHCVPMEEQKLEVLKKFFQFNEIIWEKDRISVRGSIFDNLRSYKYQLRRHRTRK